MRHGIHHKARMAPDPLPPPISEVRIGTRKRGGHPGNRNRLKHGAFSAAARGEKARIRAIIAKAEALIVKGEMVIRARGTWPAKAGRLPRASFAAHPAVPRPPKLDRKPRSAPRRRRDS